MYRQIARLAIPLLLVLLAFALGSLVFAQEGSDTWAGQDAATMGSDSNPVGEAEIVIPERYRASVQRSAAADEAVATVYFTPQDEDGSTTVLFLYNTAHTTGTVGLETFNLNGSRVISTSVAVPPNSLVRIAADTVEDLGTWSDALLINFRTSSTYAKMTLPEGVKADGYVAWNGGSTYNPLTAVPTLPLRFSIDPPTVFLPVVGQK